MNVISSQNLLPAMVILKAANAPSCQPVLSKIETGPSEIQIEFRDEIALPID